MKTTSSKLPLGILFIVLAMFPAYFASQLVGSIWIGLALFMLFKVIEIFIDLGVFFLVGEPNDSV